ncbi:Alkyltransferase-like protein [Sparassis crispa]|uniref:Alkyltransferase-like protein n=1 Tax=Sparassis crispa TaxID=139825 RepID=A0A401GPJ3_9APHY|nr:Alkyltransferase-like protein [Sparassis crispa]GBE84136.1 Alkyltransferase-like protein [Sparassis crispa]
MDSAQFHEAVYNVVRQIPQQHVTSYGHVAKLVGMPRHARHVGQALKFLMPGVQPPIPWHRVLAASGVISSRGPETDGAQRQREALEAEGVEVIDGRTGEMRVDLRRWGWFPPVGSIDTGVDAEAADNDGENHSQQEREDED